MKLLRLFAVIAAPAMALSLVGCDVDVEDKGELPDVDVEAEPGEMPEMDVEGPDVDVSTEKEEVTVPDVDVEAEKTEVPVPDVDVDMPE